MVVVKEEGAMQDRGPRAGAPCRAHGHPREAVIPGIRGLNSHVTSHALLKPANKVDCNTMKFSQNSAWCGVFVMVHVISSVREYSHECCPAPEGESSQPYNADWTNLLCFTLLLMERRDKLTT